MTIPLTAGPTVEFWPDSLKNPDVPEAKWPKFYLRVPTWEDRDMIGVRLFGMNVREVTVQHVQAVFVSELFNIGDSEEIADDNARFMESFWQRQTAYAADMAQWHEQEAQRLIDQLEAKKEFPQKDRPAETTTARERARYQVLQGDLQNRSQKVRDTLVDQQLHEKRMKAMVARLQIAGWSNLATRAKFEEAPLGSAQMLSAETIEDLRTELHDLARGGSAWTEVGAAIDAMFTLPSSAEKNSSSLPGSASLPGGSMIPSSSSEKADGSSKASPSEPTPETGSPATTGTSSASTKGSAGEIKKRGRTGAK